MKYWLELTARNGSKIWANMAKIKLILPNEEGSKLILTGDEDAFILVQEEPDQIARSLPSI